MSEELLKIAAVRAPGKRPWYSEGMSKSTSFLSKMLPADRVETPSDGERRYTLPLVFDPTDPDGFNLIREVQEHLAALQVQQWAWKKLEELLKERGIEP